MYEVRYDAVWSIHASCVTVSRMAAHCESLLHFTFARGPWPVLLHVHMHNMFCVISHLAGARGRGCSADSHPRVGRGRTPAPNHTSTSSPPAAAGSTSRSSGRASRSSRGSSARTGRSGSASSSGAGAGSWGAAGGCRCYCRYCQPLDAGGCGAAGCWLCAWGAVEPGAAGCPGQAPTGEVC